MLNINTFTDYDTYQRQVEVNCDEKVEYTDDDGNKRLRDLCYCIDHDSGQKWRMRKADLKVCCKYNNWITIDQ